MKKVFILVVLMLIVFSVSFVVTEKMGLQDAAFVNEKLACLKESEGGRVAVFCVIVALLFVDLLLPVPSSVVMLLAGVFLGTCAGSAASFAGAMAAALVGFFGCRYGGARAFSKMVGEHDASRVQSWFDDYGIAAIIISRPVPMLTEILSCMAGLSGVGWMKFVLSSVVGTAPVCVIYAYVGALYGIEGLTSYEGLTAMIWLSAGIPAAGWLFTHWVKKIRKRGGTANEV